MNGIYHLKGTVKHYDWGGFFFIPALLNLENKAKTPFAEYWMGTHPLGPSYLEKPGLPAISLEEKTGQLSYLFKVLDVKDMLSIQVHPSKQAAEIEFGRENAAGIPLDAPERSYKDANHKPELMVALGDFWLLHGFKPAEELFNVLTNISELNELLPVFKNKGYEGLYRHVMEMPQEKVNQVLKPLTERIIPLYRDNPPDKRTEDFWAARAALSFSSGGNIDRGIFSIYFFNLLMLKKGEGIFQAAGIPHAYLEGQNVEIMANSDNVLRGGLTTKHIAVKELMKHLKWEATIPGVIQAHELGGERIYETPVGDFHLAVIELDPGLSVEFSPTTPQMILMTEGKANISAGTDILPLVPGHPAAMVFPGQTIKLAGVEKSTLFRASGEVSKSVSQ